VATEALAPSFWASAGWSRRETVMDGRHLLVYAQRTIDGRIAIGGRGAPYHFGSGVHARFEANPAVTASLRPTLAGWFPALGDVAITQSWGGAVAVPRDWHASVGLDRDQGVAWAGGYVGDGVAASNLAGRTLADLITGKRSELVELPWVNHRANRWEP